MQSYIIELYPYKNGCYSHEWLKKKHVQREELPIERQNIPAQNTFTAGQTVSQFHSLQTSQVILSIEKN